MTAARVTIEQAGTIGTASHVFHVSKPVAVAEKATESYGYLYGWKLRSLTSREIVGELTTTGFDGIYAAWDVDEVRGESSLAKSGVTFMEGITAILGTPGAGYTHYRKAS